MAGGSKANGSNDGINRYKVACMYFKPGLVLQLEFSFQGISEMTKINYFNPALLCMLFAACANSAVAGQALDANESAMVTWSEAGVLTLNSPRLSSFSYLKIVACCVGQLNPHPVSGYSSSVTLRLLAWRCLPTDF